MKMEYMELSIGGFFVIEIIYKDDSEKNNTDTVIKLPKNIRQIGEGGLDNQIYIEDNIMNYLKKVPVNDNDIRYGVLLGTVKKGYGYTYIFINAAVDVEDIVENTVIFSDEIWTSINDNIRRYFNNLKVVGWFTSLNYAYNNDMPYINRIHLDNFAGIDKVYLRMDRIEDEENFYIYGSGGLKKQPGYHVYYEKNYNMEDYIYGSDISRKFLGSVKQVKTDKSEAIGINSKTSSNNSARQENKSSAKYGIEENATKGKVINAESAFKVISKNIASIAMVLMLVGTVALVSNENAMDKVRGKIAQILDGGSGYDQQKIPVAGIINETETTTKIEETSETEATKQTTEKSTADSQSETTSMTSGENEETTTAKKADAEQGTTNKENASEEYTTSYEEPSASVSVVDPKYYTVKYGDTLTSIAVKLYNDPSVVKEIMKLNNMTDGNLIKEGEKLIVP
jgi:hypothetical protein